MKRPSYPDFTRLRGIVCLFCCLLLVACAGSRERGGKAAGRSALPPAVASASPEAEKLYNDALALWKHPLASVRAAHVSTDPGKAAALLDKALALEPAYAEAYALRGLARSELNLREEAFDDLTMSIRLRPTPQSYAYRALASMRGGQTQAAKRDLDYAMRIDPAHNAAHNYFGLLALNGGDKSGACSAFSKGCSNGDCSFLDAARSEKICP